MTREQAENIREDAENMDFGFFAADIAGRPLTTEQEEAKKAFSEVAEEAAKIRRG